MKLYKSCYARFIGNKTWSGAANTALKSKELADRFNADIKTEKPITVIIPWLARVHEVSNFKWLWLFPEFRDVRGNENQTKILADELIPREATVAVEDILEGNYDKFVSNGGWVNEDVPTNGPPAFAHYSYHITNGEMLVCDLQGIRKTDGYLFTDPAIHHATRGPHFCGPTDLGNAGIQQFFQSHVCSRFCERLRKPDMDNSSDFSGFFQNIVPPHRNTVYTYELGNNWVHEQIRRKHLRIEQE